MPSRCTCSLMDQRIIGSLFMKYVATLRLHRTADKLGCSFNCRPASAPGVCLCKRLGSLVAIGCVFQYRDSVGHRNRDCKADPTEALHPRFDCRDCNRATTDSHTPRGAGTGRFSGTTLTSISLYVITDSVASRYFRFTVRSSSILYLGVGAGIPGLLCGTLRAVCFRFPRRYDSLGHRWNVHIFSCGPSHSPDHVRRSLCPCRPVPEQVGRQVICCVD